MTKLSVLTENIVNMSIHTTTGGRPTIELISNPDSVKVLLKPPRLVLLSALREPGRSSLARALDRPRQRLNHHLRELERVGLIVLVVF